MFNLFKKKPTINSISSLPDWGWIMEQNTEGVKQWVNKEETRAMSIHFFDLPPDLPTIQDIGILRTYYRDLIAKNNFGLIQVDKLLIKGFEVIQTIFKIPQQPTGMTYLASLTIPFETCSYVIKIQAPEIGITGSRDTVILTKFMNEGLISFEGDKLVGWAQDPYDSGISEGTLMNLSEQEQYDALFPEHPLTEARKLLNAVKADMQFGEELGKLRAFGK